jgi:hypothetical protein
MRLSRCALLLLGPILVIGGLGCSTGKQRLNLIRLNMSKLEVAKVMGREGQAMASETTADGKIKEVWDYEFGDFLAEETEVYRLTFIDDKLIKWGKR